MQEGVNLDGEGNTSITCAQRSVGKTKRSNKRSDRSGGVKKTSEVWFESHGERSILLPFTS